MESETRFPRLVPISYEILPFIARVLIDLLGYYVFKRATVLPPRMPPDPLDKSARMPNGKPYPQIRLCQACGHTHPIGSCPLKLAGVEHCNICGMAHFGHARVCPHIKSETQVVEMLTALKNSPEPRHLVEAASKYLRDVKGTLVQAKKTAREKAERAKALENAKGNGVGADGPNGVTASARGPEMPEELSPLQAMENDSI